MKGWGMKAGGGGMFGKIGGGNMGGIVGVGCEL